MNFIEPDWLYLLTIPLILMPLLAIIGRSKRRKRLTALLGANANSPDAVHLSGGRRFWRVVLICGTVFFIVAACARPSFYARLLPFEEKGRDLLVLCDVSRSMNAADIAPSRLRHAQYLLRQLSAREKGDRFGLVPFAGSAYLSCPLTSDPVTFNEYADDLSTDSVPAGGTNLEKAFQVALKAFEGSQSGNRAVILLTDGEELQGNIKALTAQLVKRNIPVFAVGFGDPVRGAVIPREPGKAALIRDRQGKIVTSKLNEKLLSALAADTKGVYIRTTATDSGLPQLESAIDALDRRNRENVKHKLPVEEFPKVLAAALAALLVFLLLSERKSAAALLFLTLFLPLMAGGAESPGLAPAPEKNASGVLSAPPPAVPEPETPEELYNQARRMQISGAKGYEELYRKLIGRLPGNSSLRSRSFHNLGAAMHDRCRSQAGKIRSQLEKQQLNEALKEVKESLTLADGAEELYSAAVSGGAALPPELPPNLSKLARERKMLEELKKKIEELMKQQQKAQDQTSSARQQNRSKPQNQQQRQQQQRSIDQAQKESQKLQKQAQELKQSKMEKSAQKASEELKKASEAKKKGQDKKSSEHIDKALKELAGNQGASQKQEKKNGKNDPQKNSGKDDRKQPSQGRPSPQQTEVPKDRKGAEQMLELMGEEDKKLRSAVKKQLRMNRQQTEKDW